MQATLFIYQMKKVLYVHTRYKDVSLYPWAELYLLSTCRLNDDTSHLHLLINQNLNINIVCLLKQWFQRNDYCVVCA